VISRLLLPTPILALATLAIHLVVGGGYGYFRDELYFIVCGLHPDWGYVDQPPLVPLVAGAVHRLFPFSVVMFRLVPALAHAATVALTAETARLLGGGRWAQALAGLCVLGSGVYLAFGTILTTDVIQPLSWLFCGYALIRIIRGRDERWWLALGVVAGVALLSKYMIAFWLAALGIGLVATPARRSLARPHLYLGAGIAALIVLPNVIWQASHDWPFLEIGRHAAEGKNIALSPVDFLLAQGKQLDWAAAPVWLAGLVAFAFWRRFADLRLFAIAFVALMAAMIAMHAKPYYPAGIYPLFFAGGGAALEALLASTALRAALTAAVVLFAVIAAPFALPILPIERFAAYQAALDQAPQPMEHHELGRLPQYYADMFGWRELAALVGRAYQSLPEAERAQAVFFANNYGEAGAIDVFGPDLGLPPAIAAHNNYFLWGPRGHDGRVVIRLGSTRENLLKNYETVEAFAMFEEPWAMPYETGKTVWICRGRKEPLESAWAGMKSFN
jgi:hypothetical protein